MQKIGKAVNDRPHVKSIWCSLNLMYYYFTLGFYILLLIGQSLWFVWLNPNNPEPLIPVTLSLLFIVTPLLIPLQGLLHGRLKTYKSSSLFIWLYFIYGVWNVVSETQWPLGVLQIICSLCIYLFAILYIRRHKSS